MGTTTDAALRVDTAMLAAMPPPGTVLTTDPDTTMSWAAAHLLAERRVGWGSPTSAGRPAGPPPGTRLGTRLHVDLTIEHAPSTRLVLGTASARFLEAFDAPVAFAEREDTGSLPSTSLTALAERRSPAASSFVVQGTGDTVVGGVLLVERGPRSVFETLRVMVALPGGDDGDLRDRLEAGLQAVSLGRHPQAALFSSSRGRTDGLVDLGSLRPPVPVAVFAGARGARARGLTAGLARELGGVQVGSARAPGFLFAFRGAEADRWRAAADLARRMPPDPQRLRSASVPGDDGSWTGEVR